MAVDTLGNLLAALVTPANEQERAQVDALAAQIQEVTGDSVEIAFVDQGYTGEQPAADAGAWDPAGSGQTAFRQARLCAVAARWVVERSFGWMARFRRLVRDYERLSETLVGLHFVAFAMLMARHFVTLMAESS